MKSTYSTPRAFSANGALKRGKLFLTLILGWYLNVRMEFNHYYLTPDLKNGHFDMASQYTDWSSVCQSNCEMDIARDIIRDGQQIENRIGYSEGNVLTFDDKRQQDISPNLLTIKDPLQNSRNHTPITPINLPKSSKARPSFQYNRCSYNFGAPFQNSNNNPEYHLRHPTVFLGNPNSANGTRLLAKRNRENTETDFDQNFRSTTFRPTDHDRKNPQYIDFTTPGIVRAPYEVEISNSKSNDKTKNTLKRTISNISEKLIQGTNCCGKWSNSIVEDSSIKTLDPAILSKLNQNIYDPYNYQQILQQYHENLKPDPNDKTEVLVINKKFYDKKIAENWLPGLSKFGETNNFESGVFDFRQNLGFKNDLSNLSSSNFFSLGCGNCRIWVTARTCQVIFLMLVTACVSFAAVYVPIILLQKFNDQGNVTVVDYWTTDAPFDYDYPGTGVIEGGQENQAPSNPIQINQYNPTNAPNHPPVYQPIKPTKRPIQTTRPNNNRPNSKPKINRPKNTPKKNDNRPNKKPTDEDYNPLIGILGADYFTIHDGSGGGEPIGYGRGVMEEYDHQQEINFSNIVKDKNEAEYENYYDQEYQEKLEAEMKKKQREYERELERERQREQLKKEREEERNNQKNKKDPQMTVEEFLDGASVRQLTDVMGQQADKIISDQIGFSTTSDTRPIERFYTEKPNLAMRTSQKIEETDRPDPLTRLEQTIQKYIEHKENENNKLDNETDSKSRILSIATTTKTPPIKRAKIKVPTKTKAKSPAKYYTKGPKRGQLRPNFLQASQIKMENEANSNSMSERSLKIDLEDQEQRKPESLLDLLHRRKLQYKQQQAVINAKSPTGIENEGQLPPSVTDFIKSLEKLENFGDTTSKDIEIESLREKLLGGSDKNKVDFSVRRIDNQIQESLKTFASTGQIATTTIKNQVVLEDQEHEPEEIALEPPKPQTITTTTEKQKTTPTKTPVAAKKFPKEAPDRVYKPSFGGSFRAHQLMSRLG